MAVIVVVDDERPMREFLSRALEDGGHRVLQAFHGRHALSVVASSGAERPDLVLADVMMPLIGGVELCRRLKADPDTANIPVILMSAASARATLGSGADAFIAKPFDLDALDALITRLLAQRSSAAHVDASSPCHPQ